MLEKDKMLYTIIFSFSHNVFHPFQHNFQFLIHIYYFVGQSENSFNLDQSKIMLFGKELPDNKF